MKTLWMRSLELSDRFAEAAGRILSWSVWFPIIIFGTIAWVTFSDVTKGRFDPGLTTLVLVLTIQTSLDSVATKLFQLALRRSDEKRDAQWQQQLASTAALTVQIKEELDHSRERETAMLELDTAALSRDDATEKRDEIVYKLLSKLVDKIEIHPGDPNEFR